MDRRSKRGSLTLTPPIENSLQDTPQGVSDIPLADDMAQPSVDSAAHGEVTQVMEPVPSPLALTKRQWAWAAKATAQALLSGPTTLVSAGCAFYTTLALFPSISILISIYGLAFDVQSVATQLNTVRRLLPPAAFTLIEDRIQILVSEPHSSLTLNLLVSTLIALWSASAGVKAILSSLNIAYDTEEKRGFLAFQALALGMTLASTIGVCLSVAILVAIPVALKYLPALLLIDPPAGSIEFAVRMSGLGVMTAFMITTLMALYRFGPSRTHAQWRWVAPGAIISTVLWIVSASGFSYYVAHLANYTSTYGPLGAVVAIMMWFFVSAWVVLLGAELNAELEAFSLPSGPRKVGPGDTRLHGGRKI